MTPSERVRVLARLRRDRERRGGEPEPSEERVMRSTLASLRMASVPEETLRAVFGDVVDRHPRVQDGGGDVVR